MRFERRALPSASPASVSPSSGRAGWEGLCGVPLLGLDVVKAHALPLPAGGVTVGECEPSPACSACAAARRKYSLEKEAFPCVTVCPSGGEDRLAEQVGVAAFSCARPVGQEADVLLAIDTQQVTGEPAMGLAGESDAEAAH